MSDPVQAVQEQEVYVGPRPFERSERNLFFGRDREISELLSLVTSSRVVLCYAPSGAGKTSLINAGLLPRLEKEGFEVLPPTRVRGLVPEGLDQAKTPNLYMFNALMSLAGEGETPAELTGRTLADFLSKRPHETDEEGFPAPRILIFDQFEELLTSYPERWQEREGFFQQVHDALQADPLLRVIFVMREDFLARIEPFTRLLKPFPQARFHLDLLKKEGAYAAVIGPLKGTGKGYKEGVAEALIEELLKVRVETTQGEAVEVGGEYVEPVQLQVVCRNLWMSLPPDVQEISAEHLKAYGDVDHALRDFYEDTVAQAKTSKGANELRLRQWFEQQLITPAGTRGIVFRDAKLTAGLPNPVVDFLEDRHLIRGEWRAGSRWYELTHDRFIEPIQKANERWRAGRHANRNRWIMVGAGLLMLVVASIAVAINTGQTGAQSADVSTAVAATVVVDRATAQVQAEEVAQEDVSLSRSRQLAAEALLVNDPNLALLLAVEANQSKDTPEARRSLHRVLSGQAVIDGQFLREFNPETVSPTLVKLLEEHNGWVLGLAFSPDGQQFVSGSQDGSLILWDVAAAAPVLPPLIGHKSNVFSVAFSRDGKLIASAGVDARILLWDAATGEQVGELLGHAGLITSIAFSPDGTRLASGGDDNTIRIWNISTRKQTQEIPEPAEVWTVAWSPDGKTLAAGSAGAHVRLWDTETFTKVRPLIGHSGLVRALAWSLDGRILATASVPPEGSNGQGQVFLWDVPSGEIIARPVPNSILPSRAVAFDPNGRILVIGRDDGSLVLWDLLSEQFLPNSLKAQKHRIMSLAFSPDGRYLVSGSVDQTVALWAFFAPTRSVAISPDGTLLAAGKGSDVYIWDVSSDQTIPLMILSGQTEDVLALAFSPDGKYIVSGNGDNTARVWDAVTGEKIAHMVHDNWVTTVAFSPDGKSVVSGSGDNTVRVWEASTGEEIAHVHHDDWVNMVAFSPDGNYVVSGSNDSTARVWEALTGEEIARMRHNAPVIWVAFSPDGKYVVSGCSDNTARVWEVSTGDEIAHMSHNNWVSAVTFSPDGKYVVSGSYDSTLRVWEALTGEEIASMSHDDWVTTVTFSPDGKYIVSGSLDNTIRVWEASTGNQISVLSTFGATITSLSLGPDGRILAIGTESGTVLLWDLSLLYDGAESESTLELACSLAQRNLTPAEWKQYFGDEPYRGTCPNLPLEEN